MARLGPPPYFHDWTPEQLKEELEKRQEKHQELLREAEHYNRKVRANRDTIKQMQFYLICNSGHRDALRGWKGEGG